MADQTDWKQLDGDVTVAAQIHPGDIADIAAAGYRMVICNRPDGEDPGQADWETIAALCRQHGLVAKYMPQADRHPTGYAVDSFAAALSEADGRIFAYCRSGTRCEILWTAARARS